MTRKRVRIIDIARLAGVSIGTVDRVLHDRRGVAEKTKKKIESILDETNYKTNMIARVLKLEKQFHIVVLIPKTIKGNTFWGKHIIGIKRAINDLDHFPIIISTVTFNMHSEEDFQIKGEEALNLEPDGVVLAPIFYSESVEFCSRLSKLNIPFAFIESYIEETDFIAYTGEDNFRSGRIAAQLGDLIQSDKKDILVVSISKHIQNAHQINSRVRGFLDYHEKSSVNKRKIINQNIPESSTSIVRAYMDKVFSEHPNISSIFVSGSKSFLIASYLKNKKIDSIDIVGYELHNDNVKFLKKGNIKFLIGQRPVESTYKSIKKLFEYLALSKTPDRLEFIPVDIVTSENVDMFFLNPLKAK